MAIIRFIPLLLPQSNKTTYTLYICIHIIYIYMIFYFDIHPDFFPHLKDSQNIIKTPKNNEVELPSPPVAKRRKSKSLVSQNRGNRTIQASLGITVWKLSFHLKMGENSSWKLGRVLELGVLIYLPDIASSPWNFLRNLIRRSFFRHFLEKMMTKVGR